ncbi:MAG: hypothetical protein IPM92_12190 [Saprospiraceae bacterium]|nr:hypothetical protein [Saprospiraceae bacterium]
MMRMLILMCAIGMFWVQCKPAITIINPKPIEIEWITGIWKHKDKEFYEKWVKISDSEYTGVAYDLNMGYASVHEYMRIYKQGKEEWYFEAKVKENDFKPVLFKWIPDPVIELKFINELHDYPQIVMYKREAFDVMTGSISNLKGDQVHHSDYMRFAVK